MKYFSLIIFIFLLASCSGRLSEISINSNLQEGDGISVALYSKTTKHYHSLNGVTVTFEDAARKIVHIPLPDSLIQNIHAISITIHSYSDKVLAISSIRLKGFGTIYPKNIMQTLWWQHGLMFEFDAKSNTIKSYINKDVPGTFPVGISLYDPHPPSLLFFFRLSLLATFFILILILCKQDPFDRSLLFTVALFLSSLFLKIDYANYTIGIMSLNVFVTFIYNKPRRFTWQPIFYVLFAIYLMNVIGLLYTGDLKMGIKRLDTSVVLLLFPVVFSMIQFPKKNMILLFRYFVWSAIAFCTFGFLSYSTIVPEFTWDMVFRGSKFNAPLLMMWPAHPHPSYLSSILLMSVPVALFLRYQNEKQITMLEVLLGVLLPIVFTVLSGARVGMMIVPFLLVLGYLFYCKFKPAFKWGLVVAGITAMGVMFHLYPKADDRFIDPIRVDLRKTAISAIKEKPVFGWGTGYVTPLIQDEQRAHSLGIETPYQYNQFHNQYLEDMVQFGIPGILLILVLFGWMLWIGVCERCFLMLSFLVIYTSFCWTETVFFVAKGVIPFSFWLCFLMVNRSKIVRHVSIVRC